ncbi:MAG TPA: hypothetical protein VEA69_22320 [Tepidisphaeraceae bacterium]|nr:hypothetical protein [Tepidisphaeraceae bacterium]
MKYLTLLLLLVLSLPTLAETPAPAPDPKLAAALEKAFAAKPGTPEFNAALQSAAPLATAVDVATDPEKTAFKKLTLNSAGKRIDVIRFRTPAGKPLDLSWAFAAGPNSVEVWYILPAQGEMKGFTNFHRIKPETVNKKYEIPATHGVIAQHLPAANFKPDADYLLWFTFPDAKPHDVHVAINFVPTTGNNDAALRKALNLK